ncbi:MAG: sugar ABC transporter permease [Actinobacteria bacterium]|nr:MAG: sugar ABC transporter permease [Actinomycetota bacterium]
MKGYKRVSLVNYLYIMPVLVLIGMIFIYPLIQVGILSFYDIRMGAQEGLFVGLDNYRLIFSEPVFWKSIKSTLIWTFCSLILQLIIPLGMAILLNQKLKGVHFIRTSILLPWIIPMVALAVSMRWMLMPGMGIFNEVLKNTIGTQINFLGSQSAAMPTLIVLNTWKILPFGTLLILTALQTIPEEIYEAARVDGANFWRQFIHITFPLLGKVIWFMGFLVLVWNFNTFDTIWLTTEGGPGHIMQTLPILVYRRAFKVFRLGEGAAIATIGAIFLIVVGVLYFKFLSPKRDNES